MRKLLMLGLLLWGSAGAEKLYTVTVKTSPFFTNNTYVATSPRSSVTRLERPEYDLTQSGVTATFRLPAGQFDFSAAGPIGTSKEYEAGRLKFTIQSNAEVTIPVQRYPVMPNMGSADSAALHGLLLKVHGLQATCSKDIADLCAVVWNTSVKAAHDEISAYTPLVQTQAWEAVQDKFWTPLPSWGPFQLWRPFQFLGSYSFVGQFQIAGKPYQLELRSTNHKGDTILLIRKN